MMEMRPGGRAVLRGHAMCASSLSFLVPLPVPDVRISMTYHDVGCDKLAAKTVDLTIDMAASAGTPDWG